MHAYRPLLLLLLALSCLFPLGAKAEERGTTHVILLPRDVFGDGRTHTVTLFFHNRGLAPRRARVSLESIGIPGERILEELRLQPKAWSSFNRVLEPEDQRALIVWSAPQVVVAAELEVDFDGVPGSRVDLPVASRARSFAGGTTAHILGVGRTPSGDKLTDFFLVKVSDEPSISCDLLALRQDGHGIHLETTLAGERAMLAPDFLEGLDAHFGGDSSDARAEVTCTGDFYALAVLHDFENGRLRLRSP